MKPSTPARHGPLPEVPDRLRRCCLLAGAAAVGAWPGLGMAVEGAAGFPAATGPDAGPAARGKPVVWPAVSLLDGRRLEPSDFAGRAVVVVFWSTHCGFCRRHNQHVEQLNRAAAGSPLLVLGVARERDARAVARHAQQQGYTFPITLDHEALAAALSPRNLVPLTVTVDRQGRLHEVIPGEMFEDDVLGLLKLARVNHPEGERR